MASQVTLNLASVQAPSVFVSLPLLRLCGGSDGRVAVEAAGRAGWNHYYGGIFMCSIRMRYLSHHGRVVPESAAHQGNDSGRRTLYAGAVLGHSSLAQEV